MPSPYRALFAAPGSKGFSAAGFLGRMPLSMMGIGVVTMISQLTGRYGSRAPSPPPSPCPRPDRAADLAPGRPARQRRVLRPATLVALLAAAGLLLAAHFTWPDWTLFVCAAGIGAVPSLGP